MDLTVRERLLIGAFFPKQGNKRDQRIVRDLVRKVVLPEDEKAEIEFVQDKDGIRWSAEKAKEIAVELNDDEREFLKRQVHRLDEEEAFDQNLLALAERIEAL
jgi:hypothetical protein